jgi:hypothetical protein
MWKVLPVVKPTLSFPPNDLKLPKSLQPFWCNRTCVWSTRWSFQLHFDRGLRDRAALRQAWRRVLINQEMSDFCFQWISVWILVRQQLGRGNVSSWSSCLVASFIRIFCHVM